MKISFLGTNGWYDTNIGSTICVLVETRSAYFIFDAGNGLHRIDRYIKRNKPIYLFLSHYHLDHVVGLHIMNKFNFTQGIDVFGPPGLKVFFKRVINKPYTIPIFNLKTRLRLHEIAQSTVLPFGIVCKSLHHSSLCYGYRLSSEGKMVAYCTDTGFCKNLLFLANDVDLLIADCSFKKGQESKKWPHLNPETAAKVAKKCKVKKLALLHFDASIYKNFKDRKAAEKTSKRIFTNSFAATDNMEIEI
jgi:ribonuclease BN (tRNA processing enzyme)